MKLSKKLAHLLVHKGWTQQEAARRAHISQSVFSSYLREKKPVSPGLKAIKSLAKVFGATVDFLLDESKGWMPPTDHRLDIPKIEKIVVKDSTIELWPEDKAGRPFVVSRSKDVQVEGVVWR